MKKALDGIRVLDLADESGVYCGKLLADMGADVVRVEPPDGDPMRDIGPFAEFAAARHDRAADPRHQSLFFWHYNTNKRSVVLDLSASRERSRFDALVRHADVLIVTGGPAQLRERGLDYASLVPVNPGIILAAISGFGLDGPRADWLSCDTVAQALGGMIFVNGHPDEAPLRSLGLQAYHSASTYAAIGVVLALLARRHGSSGQLIDVSLEEAVAATVEHVSGFFRQERGIEVRRGTLHWSRYFRVVRCKDGYALHCTLGDWTSLVEWVNMDGKAQDLIEPQWEDFNHRRRNCVHLFDVLDEWARQYTVAELVEGAQLRRLPYAPVVGVEEVPRNPQLRDRGFFVPVRHQELHREITYPGAPYKFSATPWSLRRRPPLIGEHTAEVFEEWVERAPPSVVRAPRVVAGGESTQEGQSTAGAGTEMKRSSTGAAADGKPAGGRVLSGIRVLDFTWVVAGPVATRILADHGAEVIKIERRDSLDFGNRRGGLTGNLNRGKRSVVVNMADPRGVELIRELVPKCDIVIDNFSARVMRNWGLDYEHLRELRPDVIAMSMSGFGHTGPHRDYVSYGPTLQALAGFTLAMRHPRKEPAGWGFSYSDMVGGYTAALAALLALWHRDRTGEGQFIDLSQFEAVSATIGPTLLDVLVRHVVPPPIGNRSPERAAAPHGVYRCRDAPAPPADRWIAICVFTEEQWRSLLRLMDHPAWAGAAGFATLPDRFEHQDELDLYIEAWTRQQVAEELMEKLQAAGIPAGLVANADDFCNRDPQLKARGYWATVTTPEGGTVTVDGVPTRLSVTPGRVAAPGPLLGEHTDEVLAEVLGLAAERIAELREARVVGV